MQTVSHMPGFTMMYVCLFNCSQIG